MAITNLMIERRPLTAPELLINLQSENSQQVLIHFFRLFLISHKIRFPIESHSRKAFKGAVKCTKLTD